MSTQEVFRSFVLAINHHDMEALVTLMTSDHLFVDSMGNRAVGAESMKAGWNSYFAFCPDYWIRADDVLAADDIALASGEAGGTIDDVTWQTPAAWKAIVREDKVAEWRVFADNKPVYEILAKRSSGAPIC